MPLFYLLRLLYSGECLGTSLNLGLERQNYSDRAHGYTKKRENGANLANVSGIESDLRAYIVRRTRIY